MQGPAAVIYQRGMGNSSNEDIENHCVDVFSKYTSKSNETKILLVPFILNCTSVQKSNDARIKSLINKTVLDETVGIVAELKFSY